MLLVAGTAASGAESLRFPLVLDGDIHLNGEPAPIGTEIVAKLNGDIVGQTTTTLEGVYGDIPQNKLFITCSPEDYKNLEFYVNGIEVQLANMDLIENAQLGEIVEFNISIIFVDDDPGAGYTSIQSAVNNASDRDTIVVYSGTYIENVDVNKELIIISQSRNHDDTIVQAADSDDHVFHVTKDNVTISGFNITGATRVFSNGIKLNRVQHNTIINNKLSNNSLGINLHFSNNNLLDNNVLDKNIGNSSYSYGINIQSSSKNNTLINNKISNSYCGISISSENNTLYNNTVNSNSKGIQLIGLGNNTLFSNNVLNNTLYGIYLRESSRNMLNNNYVASNNLGIYLYRSANNTLSNNYIADNSLGIKFYYDSSSNLIYNNHFNNTDNVQDYETNIWNITKTEGTNIIGGPFLGGNYWATPNGSGFSQICWDEDNNGICDLPYDVDLPYYTKKKNIDYLPLSEINVEFNPLVYDANSNGTIEKGEVIESIKDYFGDKISKDNVIEVIVEYFNT